MTIREARPDDWPAVSALLAELGRPAVSGTADEEAARDIYLQYLERPDTVVLVAEVGGRLVGVVDMEYRARLNFTQPQAWIPDLVVAGSKRSAGVGAALLTRAEEMARAHGCWGIELESATWRERAHAFYIREGWTQAGLSFFKNLTDQPWPPPPPDQR
ncbi:MAG TPA: GNAT family N-acetyltransferase [Actinomycetota bacterium]|nr:GNAT family N-acetyltransferase [Actinomycetota bacterium]